MFIVCGKSIDNSNMYNYIWTAYSIFSVVSTPEIKNIIFSSLIILFLIYTNITSRNYLLKKALSFLSVIIFYYISIVYGKIKG